MKWDKCKDAFQTDGSLRDIYVLNTAIMDWVRLFDVCSMYDATLYCDGDPIPMILDPATVFQRSSEHSYYLKVLVEGVALHCHFFTVEEIEIDVDPKEIKSQPDLDVVLDVMGSIGRGLAKPVILTEEAAQDFVWIAFDPVENAFAFFEH